MTKERRPATGGLTTIRQSAPNPLTPGFSVAVVADGLFATHPVPAAERVLIGRGEDCDARIEHPSVSRNHAGLSTIGGLTIWDLGSSNGTHVRGRKLETGVPTAIGCGEVVMLGTVAIIVQERVSRPPTRRVWPHAYLTNRLEEECTRSVLDGTACSILRASAANQEQHAQLLGILAAVLDSRGVLADYSPNVSDAVLVGIDARVAAAMSAEILRRSKAAGIEVEVATASLPEDGLLADELLLAVRQKIDGSSAADVASNDIVVADDRIRDLHRLIRKVANSDVSVLLLGETGVGKEIMAQLLHKNSSRSDKPLLRLNCAALSEQLLESELFGHVKGAFTGADAAKVGLLQNANGGTVFLDEVGDMPMSVQVKLLRVIEERKVTPVGGLRPVDLDVRFVAATHVDLDQAIYLGKFRSDLYFRLSGIALTVPPLRQRKSEIMLLAERFIADRCAQLRCTPPRVSDEARQLLESYAWPGNIRELRNFVERAVILCDGDRIGAEHLPVDRLLGPPSFLVSHTIAPPSRRSAQPAQAEADPKVDLDVPLGTALEAHRESIERSQILAALAKAGGNQTRAAKILGISRRTLIRRLERYGIARPRRGE